MLAGFVPVVEKPHDVAQFMGECGRVDNGDAEGIGGMSRRLGAHCVCDSAYLSVPLRTKQYDDVRMDPVTDGVDFVQIAVGRVPETHNIYP